MKLYKKIKHNEKKYMYRTQTLASDVQGQGHSQVSEVKSLLYCTKIKGIPLKRANIFLSETVCIRLISFPAFEKKVRKGVLLQYFFSVLQYILYILMVHQIFLKKQTIFFLHV